MAGLAGNALARHLVSSVPHHPTSCYFFLAASLLRIITNLMYWFLATAAVTFIVLSRSLFLISYSSHGKKCRCAFFIMPQPRFRFNLIIYYFPAAPLPHAMHNLYLLVPGHCRDCSCYFQPRFFFATGLYVLVFGHCLNL